MAAVDIHISPHSMGTMPPVVKSRVNSTKAVSMERHAHQRLNPLALPSPKKRGCSTHVKYANDDARTTSEKTTATSSSMSAFTSRPLSYRR